MVAIPLSSEEEPVQRPTGAGSIWRDILSMSRFVSTPPPAEDNERISPNEVSVVISPFAEDDGFPAPRPIRRYLV